METVEWRPGPSLHTLCRCCLADGCYKDISTEYFWMGKREVYSEMLSSALDITISYSQSGGPNSNSRLICETCIARLRDATDFKKQVLDCEKTFLQHIDPGRPTTTVIEISPAPAQSGVKLEQVKEEKSITELDDLHDYNDAADVVDDEDDDDDDLDDQPLTKLASKIPKKETADILDLLDNKEATKRKSTIKIKVKSKKSKKDKGKAKLNVKPSASKEIIKKEKKRDETPGRSLNPDKRTTRIIVATRGRSLDSDKQNARTIMENSTALPFQIIDTLITCCICQQACNSPDIFRFHMKNEHPTLDLWMSNKKDVQIRVDISCLKCRRCPKKFDNLDSVTKHLIDEHELNIDAEQGLGLVPIRLETNRFECVVCNKKFTGLVQLSRHTGTHFVKKTCHVCGKRFETLGGVENHLRQHKKSPHYCIYCKNSFPSLEAKKQHVRENKSCLPFRCNICPERFLYWDRRQAHLVQAHGKPKQVFRCTECDASYFNRTLLYFHFKSVHTDDHKCQYCAMKFPTRKRLEEHTHLHTGERPFQCSVCQKTFVREKCLRRHVALHDGSKKVSCQVCSRVFSEKRRLKEHLKKHHPEVNVDNSLISTDVAKSS